MGSRPVHLVSLSHSVGDERLVQALLLTHPLEELGDVPLDLSVLLGEDLRVLSRRVGRVCRQLPRDRRLRRIPLQIALSPSFSRGLRVGHVWLRSGIAAIFLVGRQALRKEVPRVAIYLVELLENDMLRLGEDLLQLHVLELWIVFLHLDGGPAHLTRLLGELIRSGVALRMRRKDLLLCVADVDEILHSIVGVQMHLIDLPHFHLVTSELIRLHEGGLEVRVLWH